MRVVLEAIMSLKTPDNSDFASEPANSAQNVGVRHRSATSEGLSERLRRAVKEAGGNKVVSDRSGVPLPTLNNYLAGRDPKLGAMAAIAEACGVSLDWLATGRAQIGHNQPPPEVSGPRRELRLFRDAEMPRLAAALHEAFATLRERDLDPQWIDIARIVALLYDREDVIIPGGKP